MALHIVKGKLRDYICLQFQEKKLKEEIDYKMCPVKFRKKFYKYNVHFLPVIHIPVGELDVISTKKKVGEFTCRYYGKGLFNIMGGTKKKNQGRHGWVKLFVVDVREDSNGELNAIVKPVAWRVCRCWWWRD